MSPFWLIPILIIGIPLALILCFALMLFFGTYILIAYTRMDMLDVIKIVESDPEDLMMPLGKKLAEKALLFNYEAIPLLKRLKDTEVILPWVADNCIQGYLANISRMQTDSSKDAMRIALDRYRFWWDRGIYKNFSPAARSAIDAWQEYRRKQWVFKMMLRLHERIFNLDIKREDA